MSKRAIFDKKNILVTGGAGFIGSHLCDELIKTCKVICLDNFSTGDEKNIDHLLANPNFAFIKHDISEKINLEDSPSLQKFKIQFQGIQEIYHLACPSSPKDFKNNLESVILANSYGIKNVIDLAIEYKAKLMHFSSSVIYGPRKKENFRVNENNLGSVDILSPRSAYDEGKRFAETMIKNFGNIYNIDTKIVRLFRIYGPRMKLDDKQMIPDFIRDALDNKDLLILGDENFYSSFCYISDCVDAVLKIMDSDLEGPFNAGSDIDINIKDVAKKIIDFVGSNSKINYGEKELFMTPLCLPDISKIRNELGWMPVVSLDNGLKKTIEDLRANKGLKRVI